MSLSLTEIKQRRGGCYDALRRYAIDGFSASLTLWFYYSPACKQHRLWQMGSLRGSCPTWSWEEKRNKKQKKSNNLEIPLIFHALVIEFTFEVLRRPLLFPSSLSAALQDADKYSLDLQLLELVRASEPEE